VETVILIALFFSAFLTLLSGAWLFVLNVFLFKFYVSRALNETIDIVKISRPTKKEDAEEKTQQRMREEIAIMEHFLSSLSDIPSRFNFIKRFLYGNPQITFEIAVSSSGEEISFFVIMPRKFREMIEKKIHSFYPSAFVEEVKDYSIFTPQSASKGSHLRLKKEFAFPIRTYQRMETDPLQNIINSLSKLENPKEGAAVQIIIRKPSKEINLSKGREMARKMQQGEHFEKAMKGNSLGEGLKEAGREMTKAVFNPEKKKEQSLEKEKNAVLTQSEQEIIKQIETKNHKPKFEVNIRLLAAGENPERAEMILATLENAFVQFEDPALNKFVAIRDKSPNAKKLSFDFILRNFKSDQKIILDTEEVASIFHFPISTTNAPKINWLNSRIAPPPPNIPQEGLLLGFSDFRGTKTEIRLKDEDRQRHLYIIGQTGTGKSTFIEEMVKQDAQNKGLCVIDPHGDLIDNILENIPDQRAKDVIYFDPSDTERPFALNMLEHDPSRPEQKTFVINEMIAIFDKLYDLRQTGGPMFEQYMRNAMLLVMDSPEIGSTLMEVPRVLRDVDFRKEKLKRCKDIMVVEFWKKEAEKAGGEAALENIAPYITSKLTTFISNDMIRPIISQQQSTINFRKVMDEGKILLVNLSKGKIGEINSHLLGMVIVGKLLMAALSRADLPKEERKDFYLYIDEFQNFTTDSISQILAEARKYRLSLTIAHQFIGQLSENISKAVFGNVGSLCIFRVGAEDAEFLQKQVAPQFDANDLINLNNYNCITKLLINNEASSAFNMKTYPPTPGNSQKKEALKELSRLRFGRQREEVEEEIKERYQQFKKEVLAKEELLK